MHVLSAPPCTGMMTLAATGNGPSFMLALAAIAALGVGAQWLAWRLRVPSILLLLSFGLLVGPVADVVFGRPILNPDKIFGPDLLVALVELAVALILYEGGLTLRLSEISRVRGVVTRLVTLGALATWFVATLAARYILGLESWSIAFLLGAILIVTGPTVIQPMLAHIRPVGSVGPVLKWEGIVIDPIGVMVTVLVYEVIVLAQSDATGGAATAVTAGILKTVIGGTAIGFITAYLLITMMRRYWIPDFLQNPVSLMLVVVAMSLSDEIQKQSGLLSVTVMGAVLANQSTADMRHIIEFKENLRVLLISALFIVLAARLPAEALEHIGFDTVLYVGVLIVIARPLCVLVATVGAGLHWHERLFMCFMAPRGIVAASVASVFGLSLVQQHGMEEARSLAPVTFFVIIATVAFYGLTAGAIAKRFKVADQNPQGLVIIGAHQWARSLAETLSKRGVKLLLIDSNRENIRASRMLGLKTYFGNILAEYAMDDLDLTGMGRLVALTPNEEVNALSVQRFVPIFGRAEVYQLASKSEGKRDAPLPKHLRGRTLFGESLTYSVLASRLGSGWVYKATKLTEEFGFEEYRTLYGPRAVILFVISESGSVTVATADKTPEPVAGQTIISLVNPDDLLLA